jgi:hypothetical protein
MIVHTFLLYFLQRFKYSRNRDTSRTFVSSRYRMYNSHKKWLETSRELKKKSAKVDREIIVQDIQNADLDLSNDTKIPVKGPKYQHLPGTGKRFMKVCAYRQEMADQEAEKLGYEKHSVASMPCRLTHNRQGDESAFYELHDRTRHAKTKRNDKNRQQDRASKGEN